MSKKHGYGGVPRLVDIISAIPDDYKKALLPRLRARPIRTASGVRRVIPCGLSMLTNAKDCCCSCDVQAPSVSSHCDDREHLRVRYLTCLRTLELTDQQILSRRTGLRF